MTIRPRHYAELLLADTKPDLVATRLDQLGAVAGVTRRLSQLVTNPATKKSVVKLLGDLHIDPLVEAMVTELGEQGRLGWLKAILRAAEAKLAQTGAPIPVHVTAAHPITNQSALEKEISALIGPIASLDITINPKELGGIRVQAADRSLDTRLEHRLHQLRRMVRERNV